jgi:hypothetical protein
MLYKSRSVVSTKFNKMFKPQFKKLTPFQRLKKTKAYYKRRLRRLSKRANWLKRKKKRLKKYRKSRRSSVYLNYTNQCSKTAVRTLKIKKSTLHVYKLYKPFTVTMGCLIKFKPRFTKVMHINLFAKKFSYFNKL